MVDVFGVLGDRDRDPHGLGDELVGRGTGRSARFVDEDVALELRYHPVLAEVQPGRAAGGDVLTWVLGEVYGTGGDDAYTRRPTGQDTPSWLAALFAERGCDALAGLNGEFAAVIYDRRVGEATLVTDRLGSRPVFVARPAPGVLAFASSVQRLACYPGLGTCLDGDLLGEYLAFHRALGTTTPLTGVEKLPPATATTIDLETGERTDRTYWRPVYSPTDESFGRYTDRFVDTLETVLDEQTGGAVDDVGLLTSGGTDSRLLLGGLDDGVTAYHLFDWQGRETRIAERAAGATDCEYVPLRQDLDHEVQARESVGSLAAFTGWFSNAHAAGFERRLAADCDVILTGLYADTLFKGAGLQSPELDLGPLGTLTLPLVTQPSTREQFVACLLEKADAIPDEDRLRATLEGRVRMIDHGRVVHHGVTYPSLQEAFVSHNYYPLTNHSDVLFLDSLREAAPTRTPYLDNRLVELHLEYPLAYRVRRNLIGSALERLSPDLAAIPHAETGVPASAGFLTEYVGGHLNALRWKYLSTDTPPAPHLSHRSWLDSAELIRHHDFVGDVLRADEELVRALPGVEWDQAVEWYGDHLAGADHTVELYGLLTLLSMPVVRKLAGGRHPGAASEIPVADRGRSQWESVGPRPDEGGATSDGDQQPAAE